MGSVKNFSPNERAVRSNAASLSKFIDEQTEVYLDMLTEYNLTSPLDDEIEQEYRKRLAIMRETIAKNKNLLHKLDGQNV